MSRSGNDRESVASVTTRAGEHPFVRGVGSGESTSPVLLSSSSAFKISACLFISVAGERRKAEIQLNGEGLYSLDTKLTVASHSNAPNREHSLLRNYSVF